MNLSEKYMNMHEAKSIELPSVKFELVGFGKDSNGNSVVKLKNGKGKGFSIQTNGNLPKTHSIKQSGKKAKELTPEELKIVAEEAKAYIDEYGTKTMKESLDEALSELSSFAKSYLVREKESRKFWKDLGKKYPSTKDVFDDPKEGEDGYKEFKDFYSKQREKDEKALYKNIDKVIADIEMAIKEKDQKSFKTIMKLDKEKFFSKNSLDDLVERGLITKDQKSKLGRGAIESGRLVESLDEGLMPLKAVDAKSVGVGKSGGAYPDAMLVVPSSDDDAQDLFKSVGIKGNNTVSGTIKDGDDSISYEAYPYAPENDRKGVPRLLITIDTTIDSEVMRKKFRNSVLSKLGISKKVKAKGVAESMDEAKEIKPKMFQNYVGIDFDVEDKNGVLVATSEKDGRLHKITLTPETGTGNEDNAFYSLEYKESDPKGNDVNNKTLTKAKGVGNKYVGTEIKKFLGIMAKSRSKKHKSVSERYMEMF